jgi:hypothetical protein
MHAGNYVCIIFRSGTAGVVPDSTVEIFSFRYASLECGSVGTDVGHNLETT